MEDIRLPSQTTGPEQMLLKSDSFPWLQNFSWLLAGLFAFPLIQQYLRYRRLKSMKKKYGFYNQESLVKMTDQEAWEIVNYLGELEFCTMFEKGLQFALFRTYGIPSISSLLVKTAQLSTVQHAGKRYADTGVLLAEIFGNEPASDRAIDSFSRLNYLHGVYRDAGRILDDDMLYTLALFAVEPIKWIERYEWRRLSDFEKCAMGTFIKSMGDAMLIDYGNLPSAERGFKDGLHWLEEVGQWTERYEERHMVPHKDNYQTAEETTALLLFNLPDFLKPMGKQAVAVLMDDPLRRAMMYPTPPKIYFRIMEGILALRKVFLRYVALPRPSFLRYRQVNDLKDSSGRRAFRKYDAHPFYVRPTLWNRWGPSAWLSRFLNLPLPGDDGDRYHPNGFSIPQVGPNVFVGKGASAAELTKARLRSQRTGGCPFVTRR